MSFNLALRTYTTLLSIPEPLPSMGSFNYRRGEFDDRPMTVQEQNFEQFGNNRQAEHDISSAVIEWERLKAHEEDAIQLWQELDGNLEEYQRQMRTRDQQAMEFQCQRKKAKATIPQRLAQHMREYEQACLNAATCNAFQEDVRRRAMESDAQVFTEAQRQGAMEQQYQEMREKDGQSEYSRIYEQEYLSVAAQDAFSGNAKRTFAEFLEGKTMQAAAATNVQEGPSEVTSATEGVQSDLDPDLELGGQSSHSRSPEQSRFTDSVSRDPGSPSQPIDNTSESPRTSPRQPPALPQSSQTSSNSASPPRSSSVDNSTPPSSKHPSPPESPKSSPPETPTPSRFVPDPAIWGASIAADSSYHPSQSSSLNPSSQLQSFNSSWTNTPNVPSHYSHLRGLVKLNSMRYQRPQPASTSESTRREQSRSDVPIDGQRRHIMEMRRKLGRGSGDHFVTIIVGDPAGGRVDP
ncbi:hypothetical protein BDR22DRAFT_194331 [Usnea florida]